MTFAHILTYVQLIGYCGFFAWAFWLYVDDKRRTAAHGVARALLRDPEMPADERYAALVKRIAMDTANAAVALERLRARLEQLEKASSLRPR
jgi:hypothetical protein